MKRYLFFIIFIIALFGCNPGRWDHVDIEQINSDGKVVAVWEDAKILNVGPGFLSGGDAWVRFESSDGKQVSLMVPHRFKYR